MKKLVSLLLLFSMVLSLAACAKAPAETVPVTTVPAAAASSEPAPSETEASSEPAYYPVEITDHAGRTVLVEKEPERIVSGYYIATSAFIAMGLKENLVGIEAKAEKRSIYKLSAPELIDLPNVGTAKEFDPEGCIALEPDLVMLPLKLKSAAETLEQMGIPVLLVNPETEELLLGMIDMIADACNTDKNEELLSFINGEKSFLSGISGEKPDVYLAGNSGLLSTAGAAMYQSQMISLAGGRNVAEEIADTYWAEISYEQLLSWDPQYIILASDASYGVEDVLADENLADCSAVKNGNVVKMPGKAEAWDSPLPASILGSSWLASVLHEDQVSWEHTSNLIDAFYQEFYGFTYSEK